MNPLRTPLPIILLLVLSAAYPAQRTVYAQAFWLSVVPSSTVNSPGADLFSLPRPALSIAGFENSDPAVGLGLQDILLLRYATHDPLVVPVFDRIMALALADQSDPFALPPDNRWRQLDRNTNILQARAFEALVTFVLALNGYDDAGLVQLGLRPHAVAASALREALVSPPGGVLVRGDGIIVDFMRHARSIGNVARAIDLYLALENAYAQFPGVVSSSLPLSPQEKGAVMMEMATALLTVDFVLEMRAIDVFAPEIDLPPEEKAALLAFIATLPAGSRTVEEVQPGNWSMKLRLASGYGALVMQLPPGIPEAAALAALFDKAVRSGAAVGESVGDRNRQWNFMTFGGKRFWAEGPYYFDFSLEQVLPFWHAARRNGLVSEDVFLAPWLLDPLRWHADLVTPDGSLVPIDDGNRTGMRYSGLLRWSPAYGDPEIGRKNAWIEEQLGGPGRRDETLLVELAIPRTTFAEPPPATVGSTDLSLVPHVTEQQLVLRHPTPGGTVDFVYLNGEHGMAVTRGEGHEQPDQLHLLYYRDELSYLVDSGYDQGFTVENSSWNHYYDHNVMTAGEGEGGLLPPVLDIFDVRKTSETAHLGEVDALALQTHGALSLMQGEQPLSVAVGPGYPASYKRDVLYVPGATPYAIDLNRIRLDGYPVACEASLFRLHYHVNSADAALQASSDVNAAAHVRWSAIGGDASASLSIYPTSVEFDLATWDVASEYVALVPDEVQEDERGIGKTLAEIARLTISTEDRCQPFWSVFSIIQPRETSDEAVPRPMLLQPYEALSEWQGWVWRGSQNALDVYVARSVDAAEAALEFGLRQASADLPGLRFILPEAAPYGFARVRFGPEGWSVDGDYLLGLVPWDPATALADLRGEIEGGDVRSGVRNTLTTRIEHVLQNVEAGRLRVAVNQLQAFVNLLQAQAGKGVSAGDAEAWLERAEEVLWALDAGLLAGKALAESGVTHEEARPESFALFGNYPNPFNPATQIHFDLPEAGYVRLAVFDLLGRQIALLVDGEMTAGTHRVTWNAADHPSGLYVCRLHAGAYTQSTTLILTK